MKYIINRKSPDRIVIEPECKIEFIKKGICFWGAEIYTRDSINTLAYRFNVTRVVSKNNFNSYREQLQEGAWPELPSNESNKSNRKDINDNFNKLLGELKIDSLTYKDTKHYMGLKYKSPFINFDSKKESNIYATSEKLNTYPEIAFHIDVHIYSESNNDLNVKVSDIQDPHLFICTFSEMMLDEKSQLDEIKKITEEERSNLINSKKIPEVKDSCQPENEAKEFSNSNNNNNNNDDAKKSPLISTLGIFSGQSSSKIAIPVENPQSEDKNTKEKDLSNNNNNLLKK